MDSDPADRSTWKQVPVLDAEDITEARLLIAQAGLVAGPEDTRRLADALWGAKWDVATVLERRARGDYSPDANLARYPSTPGNKPHASVAPPALAIGTLLQGWAADRGWQLDMRPLPRALYDRVRTAKRLEAFLGHDNAAVITKADALRWKEDMQGRGCKVPTIRNDLSEMSAVWKAAIKQGKLPGPENPFEGVSPPKPARPKQERRGYTDAEATKILLAARGQTGFMRWLPWVCCLTGARLAEVVQGAREDVVQMNGIWVLRIHDNGTDGEEGVRSVKNADSIRNIPLHQSLIKEGFLAYVQALPANSPLFPDAPPDKTFGLRSQIAGKRLSRWLKVDVGITASTISPAHSWRHRFVEVARLAKIHPEIRSALTGHSAKLDESAGYGAGMGSFIHLLAEALAAIRLIPEGVD